MFQILTHSNLPHQLVFIAIHASQLANMGEYVLQSVSQLKGVHIV